MTWLLDWSKVGSSNAKVTGANPKEYATHNMHKLDTVKVALVKSVLLNYVFFAQNKSLSKVVHQHSMWQTLLINTYNMTHKQDFVFSCSLITELKS